MSRIRSIKPEILEDAVTAGLSDMAFRLFVACLVLADDYGRLRAEPGWLRGQVFWSRDVAMADFTAAIGELGTLIQFYEVNDQKYGAIRNWAKHQKVDKPGKPRIPEPPENPRESSARLSENLRETLATDLGPRIIGSTDLGPRTTEPAREAPRVVGPDGDSGLVFSAWRSGIAKAQGRDQPISPLPVSERQALCAFVNTYAAERGEQDLHEWIVDVAKAFVANNDVKFGGFTAKRCRQWLDDGRPNNRAGPLRVNQIVQTGRAYEVPKEMP